MKTNPAHGPMDNPNYAASGALDLLAKELWDSHQSLLNIQKTVGEVISQSAQTTGDALFELQALDRVTQCIDDFAAFASAIAGQLPPEAQIDCQAAAEKLKLSSLRDKFGHPGTGPEEAITAVEDDEAFLL